MVKFADSIDDWLLYAVFFELVYNITNAFTGLLFCYMMDKMTEIDKEAHIEPIMRQEVPFFVFIGSVKLLQDFLEKNMTEENLSVTTRTLRKNP